MYIYTPNLGLVITVFAREREQGRFRGSSDGARGSNEASVGVNWLLWSQLDLPLVVSFGSWSSRLYRIILSRSLCDNSCDPHHIVALIKPPRTWLCLPKKSTVDPFHGCPCIPVRRWRTDSPDAYYEDLSAFFSNHQLSRNGLYMNIEIDIYTNASLIDRSSARALLNNLREATQGLVKVTDWQRGPGKETKTLSLTL